MQMLEFVSGKSYLQFILIIFFEIWKSSNHLRIFDFKQETKNVPLKYSSSVDYFIHVKAFSKKNHIA